MKPKGKPRGRGIVHGDSHSVEYHAWANMIARCENNKRHDWHRYGGRGVWVCGYWRASYAAFLADMGRRPSPQHSLDRIDPYGNYEPANCRWADKSTQRRNTRAKRTISANGETLSATEWARRLGCDESVVRCRLARGWSPERSVTEPVARKHCPIRYARRPVVFFEPNVQTDGSPPAGR